MSLFGRFVWGTISAWAWNKHMRTEVMPAARKMGETRDSVRSALLQRMGRRFDDVWPEDTA